MNEAQQINRRAELLAEATAIVSKDRHSAYGKPEDNFGNIRDLWTAYLSGKTKLSSMDVTVLNILQKIARLKTNPNHRDSLVDIAGYAACGADIQASNTVPLPVEAAGQSIGPLGIQALYQRN